MRLTEIDPSEARHLRPGDACAYFGEYTSGGGFGASDTNQQIHNLKKRPGSPPAELRWKTKAVQYWGNVLVSRGGLNWEVCCTSVTFVPMPGSKPLGHPEYDDRLIQVLNCAAALKPGMDVRPLLLQNGVRESQHVVGRMNPNDIQHQLCIDQQQLQFPLRPTIIVFDDVITQGASFRAAKNILSQLPGVENVLGVFLAKTVWPNTFDFDVTDAL